MSVIVQLSK